MSVAQALLVAWPESLDYAGQFALERREAVALCLEAIGQPLYFVAFQRLHQPINDFFVDRAAICRRRFEELVACPLRQAELNSIRSLAGCRRLLDRRYVERDWLRYGFLFPSHARPSSGQAARHLASISQAKQSDNSGAIEDVDQRSGALHST